MVLGFIELTLGFFNQAICPDSPVLEPADPDRATGAAGPRICPGEGPMIFDARTIHLEPVHVHYHVGEGRHKSLRGRSDCGAADGGLASIDGETPTFGEMRSNTRCAFTAPGGRVPNCKVAQRRHTVNSASFPKCEMLFPSGWCEPDQIRWTRIARCTRPQSVAELRRRTSS